VACHRHRQRSRRVRPGMCRPSDLAWPIRPRRKKVPVKKAARGAEPAPSPGAGTASATERGRHSHVAAAALAWQAEAGRPAPGSLAARGRFPSSNASPRLARFEGASFIHAPPAAPPALATPALPTPARGFFSRPPLCQARPALPRPAAFYRGDRREPWGRGRGQQRRAAACW